MSASPLRAVLDRQHKYGAVNCRLQYPTCPHGHASLREHRRWAELVLLVKAGEICHLEQQVSIQLAPAVVLFGRKKPPLRYVADFKYHIPIPGRDDAPRIVIEDCKGQQTQVFRIKAHLLAAQGIELVLS